MVLYPLYYDYNDRDHHFSSNYPVFYFMSSLNNILLLLFHPIIILIQSLYYLVLIPGYFLKTYNRYRENKKLLCLSKFNIKYIVATSYVLLICNVILDSTLKRKKNILKMDNYKTIIDIYFIIISIDNLIDKKNLSIKKKNIQIEEIFNYIILLVKDPEGINDIENKDILTVSVRNLIEQFVIENIHLWKKEYELNLIDKINGLRKAYFYELTVKSAGQAWTANYNVSMRTIDFFIMGYQ